MTKNEKKLNEIKDFILELDEFNMISSRYVNFEYYCDLINELIEDEKKEESSKKEKKLGCVVKSMALRFITMNEQDAYCVYLLNRNFKGVEIAYRASLAWRAEPNKILALKQLEKICMSNPNGEQLI